MAGDRRDQRLRQRHPRRPHRAARRRPSGSSSCARSGSPIAQRSAPAQKTFRARHTAPRRAAPSSASKAWNASRRALRHRAVDRVALVGTVDQDRGDRAFDLDAHMDEAGRIAVHDLQGEGHALETIHAAADRGDRLAHAALAAEPGIGERDETGVGRRGRRGRAQTPARFRARRDAARAGRRRCRPRRWSARRRRSNGSASARGGPSRARNRAMRRYASLRQHLARRGIDDVGHRDVEMALGRDAARARDLACRGSAASPASARRSRRPCRRSGRAEQTCRRGMAFPGSRVPRQAASSSAKAARGSAPAPRSAAAAADRSRRPVEGNLRRAEQFARFGDREARQMGRLEIGGFAVGRLDRLGEIGGRYRRAGRSGGGSPPSSRCSTFL